MKLIMENWKRYLKEAEFYNSPDEDNPGNKQIVFFTPEFDYKKDGMTHGKMSHMIKHYGEFEKGKVYSALDAGIEAARMSPEFYLFHTKTGKLLAQGESAKKQISRNGMLNTFDMINDKILNNEELNPPEEAIAEIEGIDDPEQIKDLLNSGQTISFVGYYKGNPKDYYFNPVDTGLVAVDDGKVATLFRIHKTGNDIEKVKKYFSRGMSLSNPALKQALGIP